MLHDQSTNYDTVERAAVSGLPQSIKHRAVRVEADHPVLDGDAMDEGFLVVEEVGVGDPQLVSHSVIQSEVVGDLRVGETFVPPCLLEVHRQSVVLKKQRGDYKYDEPVSLCHVNRMSSEHPWHIAASCMDCIVRRSAKRSSVG